MRGQQSRIWRVSNIIEEVRDRRQRERDVSRIKKIILHRVGKNIPLGLSLGDTGPEIARRFLYDPKVAKFTGWENPYTFYIGARVGRIWQALPVDEVGNHARRWNRAGLGAALIGDFRHEEPSRAVWGAAIVLCNYLVRCLGLTPEDVEPHTGGSLTGTSASASKECPGGKWDMDRFRRELARDLEWEPYEDERDREARMALARRESHGIEWDGV